METNVLDSFEASVEKYGNKVAFVDKDVAFSYYRLRADARAVGTYLDGMFCEKRKAVAVIMDKSVNSIVAFLGIVYSGNFYCPIDENMPEERMKKIISVLEPMTVITDKNNLEKSQKLGLPVVIFEEAVKEWGNVHRLDEIRKESIDTDPLYIIFTSGSTGMPKGVLVNHRAMIDNMDWMHDTFNITSDDVIGNQSPFYFDNSTFDIYTGLKNGCTTYIIPSELFAFPVQLVDYLNEKKITTICWVPSALCLTANARALPGLKGKSSLNKIMFCGEVMPCKQLNMWREFLPDAVYVNLYGMTEITMCCTYYIVDREFRNEEALPIGRPCRNIEIILLDDNNQIPEKGDTGEICIRATCVSHGYYNNPDQTSKAFVQNPLNDKYKENIYKTGDLGMYSENGTLLFAGRKDYQIKHKGYRIELGEIETAAGGIADITSSACIYDDSRNRIVMFYEGEHHEKKEVKSWLETQLPDYMIPDKIFYMDSLPLNANGKIDRRTLKEKYLHGDFKQY